MAIRNVFRQLATRVVEILLGKLAVGRIIQTKTRTEQTYYGIFVIYSKKKLNTYSTFKYLGILFTSESVSENQTIATLFLITVSLFLITATLFHTIMTFYLTITVENCQIQCSQVKILQSLMETINEKTQRSVMETSCLGKVVNIVAARVLLICIRSLHTLSFHHN